MSGCWRPTQRLNVDVPATQAAVYGADFARTRQAVQQTLDRTAKLLADEGVAQGLARDEAEKAFSMASEVKQVHR